MAKNTGKKENLVPLTTEKARAIGRVGGKKSVEVRRERKLLSQIYSEILAKTYDIDGESLTLEQVVQGVLERKDSASVSMLKEIREATEGNKLAIEGSLTAPTLVINLHKDGD
jgi:hypothetical protein